ncbi:methyltransferase domain-containing protein [Bradyrhizobium sp. BRP22]|uniref:class I SAM-dependent methyltransferase n=1 Tax=Bradyrhizobium sp. BRP22 TaxID=2793821 RepID=UPI001CD2CFCB|nr:methyltransferase domain-containing protein [Bradyrhizobium sp. BRP22]MCA1453697.1 methyltransferase domain-containing protein [Bradyrhizobium sp. BRP22]
MNAPYDLSTMIAPHENSRTAPLHVLVALASYGTSNDRHLDRMIREFRSMPFEIDIVIISNIHKKPAPGIECRVGLPSKDPWSLPFAHKKLFAERADQYDLFIYSEDDILITEKNLRAFLQVNSVLRDDEIAGFLRMEKGPGGSISYPDAHDEYHWDTTSLRSRTKYVLANFTNEHAACYVLTRSQLNKAIKSGGFLVEPHEWKHDLLCSAATDPYIQCGFTKLIPISHLDDFTVHHLSDKYAGKVGVDAAEMRAQIGAMLRLANDPCAPEPLLNTETKLWRRMYSKDYYEPLKEGVLSMIPPDARTVLSVGCGSGATECWLAEKGLRVVAVPLDPVVCGSAAERGVEMVFGDFQVAKKKLGNQRFDCLLFSNVLHLVRDPVEVLSSFRDNMSTKSVAIIQAPNMLSVPEMWRRLRNPHRYRGLGNHNLSGTHVSSIGKVGAWCRKSGLRVDRTVGTLHHRAEFLRRLPAGSIELFMSPSFVSLARRKDDFKESLH